MPGRRRATRLSQKARSRPEVGWKWSERRADKKAKGGNQTAIIQGFILLFDFRLLY